jgi:hypothetical protein
MAAGAIVALVLAAVMGITNKRGIQLLVIGLLLNLLRFSLSGGRKVNRKGGSK